MSNAVRAWGAVLGLLLLLAPGTVYPQEATPSGAAAPVTNPEQLQARLAALVGATYAGRAVRCEVAREHPFADADQVPLEVVAPAQLVGGRNWFHLRRPDGATYLLPVDIAWQDTAWVATRALPVGHCLQIGDLDRQVRWHSYAPDEVALELAPLGLCLVAAQPAGGIVTRSGLAAPPVIERGALVRLVYRGTGLLVTTRAKALEDGWTGEVIRLQPVDSRRTCRGLVCSAEEVEVITP